MTVNEQRVFVFYIMLFVRVNDSACLTRVYSQYFEILGCDSPEISWTQSYEGIANSADGYCGIEGRDEMAAEVCTG